MYCISGLGADHHIFDGLNVPGVSWSHLSWLMPEGDESLADYASRMKMGMRTGIADTAPVLLGVSFGGMMAIEIAKQCPGATVIIVSSIRHRRQLPLPLKMTRHLGVGKWKLGKWKLPTNSRLLAPFQDYFLGVETQQDSRLVREYRGNVDPHYLQWSIQHIAGWQNEWQPNPLYHIHGSKDKIFPLNLVEPTHIVRGGGHLMIHNRAGEISRILAGILN